MKIVVLTGSPHENGTSFVLADSFIKGAEEWEDKGQIYAIACAERGDIEKTEYPEKAYILGKSL